MPKVIVYVPVADARWIEDRHGDLADWVRNSLKRDVAIERSRVAAQEADDEQGGAGVREPRVPLTPDRSGTAVAEPDEQTVDEEAEAVGQPLEPKQFQPDFKPTKKEKRR